MSGLTHGEAALCLAVMFLAIPLKKWRKRSIIGKSARVLIAPICWLVAIWTGVVAAILLAFSRLR